MRGLDCGAFVCEVELWSGFVNKVFALRDLDIVVNDLRIQSEKSFYLSIEYLYY